VGTWSPELQESFRGFLAEVIGDSKKMTSKWLLQAYLFGGESKMDLFGESWFDLFEVEAMHQSLSRPEIIPTSPRITSYHTLVEFLSDKRGLKDLLLGMLGALEARIGEVAGSKELIFLYLFFFFFVQFAKSFTNLSELVDILSSLKRVTELRRETASDKTLAEAYQVLSPVCLGKNCPKFDLRNI